MHFQYNSISDPLPNALVLYNTKNIGIVDYWIDKHRGVFKECDVVIAHHTLYIDKINICFVLDVLYMIQLHYVNTYHCISVAITVH